MLLNKRKNTFDALKFFTSNDIIAGSGRQKFMQSLELVVWSWARASKLERQN